VNPHDVAKILYEIEELRAELATAKAERDDARREVCTLRGGFDVKRSRCVAKVRAWNCFDAPHTNATDVPVRDGGSA